MHILICLESTKHYKDGGDTEAGGRDARIPSVYIGAMHWKADTQLAIMAVAQLRRVSIMLPSS
jgi:hypothetical protein